MGTIITGRFADVLVVTIDRQPVRNALDPPTLREMAEILSRSSAEGIRAVVITGAGTVSFSSGMDLRALSHASHQEVSEAVAEFDAAMNDEGRVPLIAAVNGSAAGGGFEIVLRCDLAVAADHAEFRLPEVQRGIVPGGGGTLLPSRIPLAVALEIGLLGDPITAQRAYHLGLVNRVGPAEQVVGMAIALGQRMAANGPRAVSRTRQLMWKTATDGAASAWAETKRTYDDPMLRKEMEEGVAAFIDKRTPTW
jgi:enoyl-CoA hydratase